jgi:tetratricopeptide (TPR) repeat protein
VPPSVAYPRARAAAERALRLDPDLPEPYATLGLIAHEYEWDWARAERNFRRAIDLRPNYAAVHHWYAILLSNLGRHDAAVAEGMRALSLDPLSTIISGDVAGVLWTAGRTADALAMIDQALDRDPSPPPIVELERAIMRLYAGQHEPAIESLERWAAIAGLPDPRITRAIADAVRDPAQRARARQALATIESAGAADRETLIPLYALIGDRRSALDGVERAHAARNPWMVFMGTLPWYDSLRSEPRFRAVLDAVGLPNGR